MGCCCRFCWWRATCLFIKPNSIWRAVACSGLTAGTQLPTSVFPFILRGVNLLGVDSVYCPMDIRLNIWHRLATDFKPANLEDFIQQEVTLQQLPEVLPILLKGQARGRILVTL